MRIMKLPTLYPCAHASRNPPSRVMLARVGGEVRVVAGSGHRLLIARNSPLMLLSGAMIEITVEY